MKQKLSSKKPSSKNISIESYLYIGLLFLFVIYFIFLVYFNIISFKKTITISHIISSYKSGKNGLNMFSDTNGNVYVVQNATLQLFFKGPELYSMLEEKKTYEIKGFGFRNEYIGTYPHITYAKEVK